jgi:hypothetical protein
VRYVKLLQSTHALTRQVCVQEAQSIDRPKIKPLKPKVL